MRLRTSDAAPTTLLQPRLWRAWRRYATKPPPSHSPSQKKKNEPKATKATGASKPHDGTAPTGKDKPSYAPKTPPKYFTSRMPASTPSSTPTTSAPSPYLYPFITPPSPSSPLETAIKRLSLTYATPLHPSLLHDIRAAAP
ncbi:hypothetical protein BDV95DRAFT_605949 [Massariosphaeria phaeospora]|uniref:Uncharacterized protein n=1 Tax=Massariosphaeria phaeospora TaxID=100035 RepID=A0A7C8MLT2_9PLEO|nr:hypothetical protein BDV95DRAFT_605949 [Massariosphaeria phaeospora]